MASVLATTLPGRVAAVTEWCYSATDTWHARMFSGATARADKAQTTAGETETCTEATTGMESGPTTSASGDGNGSLAARP